MQQTSSGDAARALPSGTVTFLFSDIEGSTERWDKHRDAMQEVLKRHDALLRSVIEVHGGHVFKTIGDAFCAVFPTAPEAINAALAAQRGIGAEDWTAVDGLRVRMAIHAGHTYERDGDYFGPAVNRVARLLAIGHGGQVLVSGVATELAQGQMPAQATLHDLGAHRLRDLAHPEQIYQLVAPDLLTEFPALRSLDELPNNLPLQVTSFVGREKEVAEIKNLLGKARLVTLVASGGVGKTRTALQVGADLLDEYPDGVWLVELGAINDAESVPGAVAAAMGIKETAGRALFETLVAYLKSRRVLVILDNCEHVIGAAAKVADAFLHGCPAVRILATGREGLGIAGETVMRLPSLAVPDSIKGMTAQHAVEYGSVALFVDRACAVVNSFALSDENAPFVAEICRRLDGIALAIELAAARIKVLNVAELAKRLDERFRLLTGGSRTALPRQQTMRALIDWSYDLLSPEEQTLFRRVSIFAGGWTLDAAMAVCADEKIESLDLLDRLSALVDKSLVAVDFDERSQRYRLLETTRQYALERLQERGEYPALARQHAQYFLEVARESERTWSTTPTRAWSATLIPELDNFRAALGWSLEKKQDIALGMRLTASLRWFWADLTAAEGRRWIRVALPLLDDTTPPDLVAKLWLAEAFINSIYVQRKAACEAAARAIEVYRTLGDRLGLAEALRARGAPLILIGKISEGEQLVGAALETFRELGESRLAAMCIRALADASDMGAQGDRARHLYREALAMLQAQGSEREVATTAGNLAEAEFQAGNIDAALASNSEAIASQRSRNDLPRLAISLSNRAAYLASLGRLDESRTVAKEAILLARDIQAEIYVIFALQHLAAVDALKGEFKRAGRLLGFCDARLEELDALREATEQGEHDRLFAVLAKELPADELTSLMDEGRALTEDQAVAEALRV